MKHLQVFHRTFFIQAIWTYEKMLSIGFAYCLAPLAEKLFPEPEQWKKFLRKNLDFFNTHPYMAGWIIGSICKIEQDATISGDAVQPDRLKKRMSEILGGIGDNLFWNSLKPATAFLGVITALSFEFWGVVAFLTTFNIPHFYHRFAGISKGYRLGFEITKILSPKRFDTIIKRISIASSVLFGGACAILLQNNMMDNLQSKLIFFIGLMAGYIALAKHISMQRLITVALSALLLYGLLLV